jgi:hypothetical protein
MQMHNPPHPQVAERLGVSASTVQRLVAGKSRVSPNRHCGCRGCWAAAPKAGWRCMTATTCGRPGNGRITRLHCDVMSVQAEIAL